MYPKKFENLEEVSQYLLENLAYNEEAGFSFAGIQPGMSFDEVEAVLGKPEILNVESDQQQTMQYNAPIDHPSEGLRDHHKLNLLFWAFNREPFNTIKFHFNYYSTGTFATPFKVFVDGFLNEVVDKFGQPGRKTLARGKEEVSYKIGKRKLETWRNHEGVRIVLK